MGLPKIIAIDGPAGSGKSTLGKMLADYLGYLYFDTGVMYRAVTLAAIQRSIPLEEEQAITSLAEEIHLDVKPPVKKEEIHSRVFLDGEDVTDSIRSSGIDANVSIISTYPGVRKALSEQQRRVGLRGKVVMVGRDIGTVVLPEADLKIYLDASIEERGRRRFAELSERGEPASMAEILASLRLRDQIDSTRKFAPLRPAEDAVIVNSEGQSIEQVYERLVNLVKTWRPKR
jgi:cytidylate kinase